MKDLPGDIPPPVAVELSLYGARYVHEKVVRILISESRRSEKYKAAERQVRDAMLRKDDE